MALTREEYEELRKDLEDAESKFDDLKGTITKIKEKLQSEFDDTEDSPDSTPPTDSKE